MQRRSRRALNPAEGDFEVKKLLLDIRYLRADLVQQVAGSHSPGTPIDGSTESVALDPTNPHILLYTSTLVDPTAHIVSIPMSTLMQPSSDGKLLSFPTVAVT